MVPTAPDSAAAAAPSARRSLLVTAALPYANGPIHLGHLVEYLQTDIWVRHQRLQGHRCYYVCAEDAHGTAIMLRAQKEGRSPQEVIDAMAPLHQADFRDFRVSFDMFHTTHSRENRELVEGIYRRLRDGGHIERRTVRQAYDEEAGMFLPDRFIRGTCPICRAPDQYGDSCEVCGSTYSPADLIDARSVVSGRAPTERDSEHLFFRLGDFASTLEAWTATGVQDEVRNKLREWFAAGLREWDISRDAPYWGFEIPDAPGKFFYVWVDAPVGYMASFRKLCDETGIEFDAFWGPDAEHEVYHFIGKDIAYFHCLFWPAMLHAAGYRMPTAVYCHGFLTIDGQKMSKSRGTFVTARTYLDHLDPEHLRYYYAARLGPGIDDIDLSLDDFVVRVNSDLVGKLVNIASRCAGFVTRLCNGRLASELPAPGLYAEAVAAGAEIAAAYEARDTARAMRRVMALADRANQYIDDEKPWQLAKSPEQLGEVQAVATQGLNLFRVMMTYLAPVLPRTAEGAAAFLRCGELTWEGRETPLLDHAIDAYQPLLQRVDPERVAAMLAASRAAAEPAAEASPAGAPDEPTEETTNVIDIDRFFETELRVATVVAAEPLPKSNKLLRLTVDLGDEAGGQRTVVAGIAKAYAAEELVGKQVVVVANLQPAKLMGVESQGMVLAASEDGTPVLLHPARPVPAGTRVR